MDLQVKFEICNFKNSGTHPCYGEITITTAQLISEPSQTFELKDEAGRSAGSLTFDNVKFAKKPSFVEYLRSGWFINMSVAIDFTASNGEVFEPTSLHRIHPDGTLNDYEKAISSVGSILEPYAYERKFAVFGFGGIPRFVGATTVSHCFNLTG